MSTRSLAWFSLSAALVAVLLFFIFRPRTADPKILKHMDSEVVAITPGNIVTDKQGKLALQFSGEVKGARTALQTSGSVAIQVEADAKPAKATTSIYRFWFQAGSIAVAPVDEPERQGTMPLDDEGKQHEATAFLEEEVFTLNQDTLLVVETHAIDEEPTRKKRRLWTTRTSEIEKLLPPTK